MRKLLLITVVLFLFSCSRVNDSGGTFYGDDFYIAGMHYKYFQASSSGGIFVVNVTKDSLEVANLIDVSDSTNDK